MSDSDDADEFERVRSRAAEAVEDGDATSVYVGLVGGAGGNEYFFANDVDDAELREAAAEQLGMLTRVIAEQSDATVEQVADHAVETAERMDLRSE
ncbi:hypothetical protein [Candidatus Halobonum tyrrellensis]|uniref:DUF8113 domain-containing protein n=1 Tax=Candidatus Halobonum tyrrellensis G22 TaxID=1324957 RepID=V4GQV0_9EURY|nr:hypothetical protein [Candidatus Halobonum tyrrellensis]ESP87426.1 hypothetical protein K933_14163 [Candidatus Halobonum tyrrellensis G22]